jgi:hypothetical protein
LNYSGLSELLQFTSGSEFYLSDSFTFYLHLSNDSEQIVTNVTVVVAVKDPQSRNKTVLDTSASAKAELKQQQHSDYIIRFNLPEPGSYVLGIQAQYVTQTGETRSLTKHFKFMVNKPLSVDSSLVTTTQVRAENRPSFLHGYQNHISDFHLTLASDWIPRKDASDQFDIIFLDFDGEHLI